MFYFAINYGNIEILVTFITAVAILAISPGPDNIYAAMISLSYGKRYGMATVIGLMSGCLIHTTLVAFGISSLIKQNEFIFIMLKVAGAFYLFYLAFRVYKSKEKIAIQKEKKNIKSWFGYYKKGFIMNLLNPKVSLFFLAFFPGFLFDPALTTMVQFLILGGIFIVVSFTVFSGIVLFSDSIASKIFKYHKADTFFKWMQIIVFVSIGFFIFFSEK